MTAIALLVGLALGAALAWVVARGRAARAELALARLEVALEDERRTAAEKLALLEQTRGDLATTFKALSAETLQTTLERFQTSAREHDDHQRKAMELLVAPMKESAAA